MKGKEVRRIRDKCRLSQSQFAELLGVSVRSVQHWELGRNPSAPVVALLKLADAGVLKKSKR